MMSPYRVRAQRPDGSIEELEILEYRLDHSRAQTVILVRSGEVQRVNAPDWTEREMKIMRFALHRFHSDAMGMMNHAAQDREGVMFKSGAVEAFSKDAKDAEALLERLK